METAEAVAVVLIPVDINRQGDNYETQILMQKMHNKDQDVIGF